MNDEDNSPDDQLSHTLDAFVEAVTDDKALRQDIAKMLVRTSAFALEKMLADDMTIAGARNLMAKYVMILLGTASQMDLGKAMEIRQMLSDDFPVAGDFVDRFVSNEYNRLMALMEVQDV